MLSIDLLDLERRMIIENFHYLGKYEMWRIVMKICVRLLMAFKKNFWTISVIRSYPGNFLSIEFCINALITP